MNGGVFALLLVIFTTIVVGAVTLRFSQLCDRSGRIKVKDNKLSVMGTLLGGLVRQNNISHSCI